MMNEFIDNEVKFNWDIYFNQLCKRAERLGVKIKETEEGYKITLDMLPIDIIDKEFKNLIDVESYLYKAETKLLDQLSEELGF